MDRLWSPWRLDYVTGPKPDPSACVFCSSRSDALVLHEGTTAYVVLNKYPYNNGHLMVVPYSHVDSLTMLSAEELHEAIELTRLSEAVLRQAYNPQGINVGLNLGRAAGAGIQEHLHIHAVPRWGGDSNFMTVIGETRVLPEDLDASARRLRPIFETLAT
jgi:ATP adenylyltransferase